MTPADLLAAADRYERHYGCRPGDGGTADKLRAGAEAMVEVERLKAAAKLYTSPAAFHQHRCAKSPHFDKCTCGLDDLRAALQESGQ